MAANQSEKRPQHCGHGHHHHHHGDQDSGIAWAFALNLSFSLAEIIGGIATNSTAIISDAIHDFGDAVTIGVAWLLNNKTKQKGSLHFSYGYDRLNIASALLTGLVLLVGSTLIVARAIPRLLAPEPVQAKWMLLLAIVGVTINLIAMVRLRRSGDRVDLRMLSLHLLEDVLGWIAVLVVALVLNFKEWYILDPILSLLIAGYIIYNVVKNLSAAVKVLLQAVPAGIDIGFLEHKIEEEIKPQNIHHLHLWTLDGEKHILSAHVKLASALSAKEQSELKQRIRKLLDIEKIHHSTIEFEQPGENCAINEELVNCRQLRSAVAAKTATDKPQH